ncbi:MAG: hypothetical protein Crog4KO_30950 [Crocinitomicaceae bacterium]
MRYAISLFSLILLLASCQSEKLLLNNVSSLSLEANQDAKLSVGSTFEYTVYAELHSGETKKVKNDNFLFFPDGKLSDAGQHRARIDQPLTSMHDSIVSFDIALEIGEYRILSSDTLTLNFKGPIRADWSKKSGRDGVQPRASSATLFGRDGLEGRPGGNGQHGIEGRHFTGYLWEETQELRMVLICDSSDLRYYYRSLRRDTVIIDLSGSDAGDGSMGGTGGDGKAGKSNKNPGNGADGGVGGSGGNGGDGGSLVLFLHPNVAFLDQSILLLNTGGKGGIAGVGGIPGKAGKALKSQLKANDGKEGVSGTSGKDGLDGPPITISKVAFDFGAF